MFFLAWRQLMAKKMQNMLILLGISFATLLYVLISGLQLGMREFITGHLLNNTAHILISGAERMIIQNEIERNFYGNENPVRWVLPPYGKRDEVRLGNYQGWQERLRNDSDVLDFSPRLNAHVILSKGNFSASVNLVGTIPERHVRITSVESYIQSGSFRALSGGTSNIVIGNKVAENLGVRVGDYINVSAGSSNWSPFKIVGILHFGSDDIDASIAFAELHHTQTLTHSPGRISQIAVALYDIDKSEPKAASWKSIGQDKVQDWKEANKMFLEMIRVQDYTRYFITSAILIVAAFGIYNVLTIMISQKRKQIAILRAIGYGPEKILSLVLYQGIILGLTGGILGLILGAGFCFLIGKIDLNIELGNSRSLILSYDLSIYLTAFFAANAVSILAAYLPARAASRLTPIDIIRADR